MTTLREAAQQALGFVTSEVWGTTPYMDVRVYEDAAKLRDALKAALAEPVQEPGCRDDGMPTSAEERHLRRLLALRAAMPHAYYDDGEAQGIEHGISIDFMREPVAHIDAKLRALNVARAIVKQSEPVQEPVAWMIYTEGGTSAYVTDNPNDLVGAYRALALYTSPPQRKPLTEEEILSVLRLAPPEPSLWPHLKDEAVVGDVQKAVLAIARAIERAHGIGEQK